MSTVAELREELIKLGMTEEEANSIKGKSNLEAEIESKKAGEIIYPAEEDGDINIAIDVLKNNEEIISNFIEEGGNYNIEEDDCQDLDPDTFHTKEEIMTLFEEDELVDGKYPKVNGLRRVANMVIGPIVNEDSSTEHLAWNMDREGILSGIKCDFSVSFLCRNNNFGETNSVIRFSDSSDCTPDFNCFGETFSKHPTAMACTRAEARALRKALRLDVVSAEEIQDASQGSILAPLVDTSGEEYIKEHQILVLKKSCENKGIDIKDLIKRLEIEKDNIEELTISDFEKISENLSKL